MLKFFHNRPIRFRKANYGTKTLTGFYMKYLLMILVLMTTTTALSNSFVVFDGKMMLKQEIVDLSSMQKEIDLTIELNLISKHASMSVRTRTLLASSLIHVLGIHGYKGCLVLGTEVDQTEIAFKPFYRCNTASGNTYNIVFVVFKGLE